MGLCFSLYISTAGKVQVDENFTTQIVQSTALTVVHPSNIPMVDSNKSETSTQLEYHTVTSKYINDYPSIASNALPMTSSGPHAPTKTAIGCIYNFSLSCSMPISCVSVYLFYFKAQ